MVELGAILALLMAWQFTAAEFLGGLAVIFVLAASLSAPATSVVRAA
ncbi:hypothetical protein ACWCP8_35540 [Streptomyces sp. NPDC002206]